MHLTFFGLFSCQKKNPLPPPYFLALELNLCPTDNAYLQTQFPCVLSKYFSLDGLEPAPPGQCVMPYPLPTPYCLLPTQRQTELNLVPQIVSKQTALTLASNLGPSILSQLVQVSTPIPWWTRSVKISSNLVPTKLCAQY